MGKFTKLVKLTKKVTKGFVAGEGNRAMKTSGTLKRARKGIQDKIHSSGRTGFKNAMDQSEDYAAKVLKDKKHIAGRSKQVTRITDAKKRAERTGMQTTSAVKQKIDRLAESQKVAANRTKVIANKKKVAANKAKYQ